ncbi:MAG: hypothetical protein ABIN13_12730 [Mucilaginibacter sp.]
MSEQRYVLTIATGKKVFVDMAANLARSFLWWHPGSDIQFQLVTDQPQFVPTDIISKIEVINVEPGQLGKGFSAKLQLDKLVSNGKTMFIDSDCLVFGPLDTVFDKFKNAGVSVVGGYISAGDWFGDIGAICRKFNVPHIPKFNGGLYYLEKGETSKKVYDTARQLESEYDKIGFTRLRGLPNDEVLMALAMQLHGQAPVPDDSTIMSDPQACQGKYKINVINGTRSLNNPPYPSPLHQDWYPFTKVSPLIVHFLGYYTLHYPYLREVYRLKKASAKKLNTLTELAAVLSIEVPAVVKEQFKRAFRPLYHKLAGVRKIKTSERV